MSYTITSQCIRCSRCPVACPTGAIKLDGTHYQIDSSLCNNCVGYYQVPQCVAICPTNGGCVPNPQDYWQQWFSNYNSLISRLRNPQAVSYWEQWFTTYSQRVSQQLAKRNSQPVEVQP
jgi:ferredoxin